MGFEYIDNATGSTLETVTTSELRQGDVIRCEGAIMDVGAIHQRNAETHPGTGHGPSIWARGYIREHHGHGAIPATWFETDETGRRYWIIQGNDLRTWARFKDPAAVNEQRDRIEAQQATRDRAKAIARRDGVSPHEALMRARDEE